MKLYEGKPRLSGLVNGPDYGDSKQSKVWILMSPPTPNRTEFSIQYYKIISFLKKCILKSLCIIDKNLPKYFKECFTAMFHNLKCWCESVCSSCYSILHIPSSIILWSWIYGKSCYISWMWLIIRLISVETKGSREGSVNDQKKFGFEIEVWTVTVQLY